MAAIGFVGLGNMGGPMAANLIKAGHKLRVFDLSQSAIAKLVEAGAEAAPSANDAAKGADAVITMLPAGHHVRDIYLGPQGLIASAPRGCLLIDCSTIDVATAREVSAAAEAAGLDMLDAPVSGGVGGAQAATLTFMAGGSESAFSRAEPILSAMGKAVIHAGGPGNGQAAKICNNMILGISMIAVSEAFTLGEKLGLSHQKLFDIASKSSGQCWSLTSYCPVPGAGACLAREPELRCRVHGGDDAERPEACPGSQPHDRREHASRRRSGLSLRAPCQPRSGRARFFGYHPVFARKILEQPASMLDADKLL